MSLVGSGIESLPIAQAMVSEELLDSLSRANLQSAIFRWLRPVNYFHNQACASFSQ